MVLHRFAVLGALALSVACMSRVRAASEPEGVRFVFDDAVRFAAVHRALAGIADTAAYLDSVYIQRGSPGLLAYKARYPLTGSGLGRAVARFPDDYAAIGARAAWLRAHQDSMRPVIDRYRAMVPDAVMLPVYFVVGQHQGIASGSEVGPLISIENGAARVRTGDLGPLLAHEITHIQQFSAVGLGRYRELYMTRRSLLGVIVREGIAEFVAERVAGGTTQERAAAYLQDHMPLVWREFRDSICATDNGDWAGGTPSDTTRPSSLGYALGAAIARAFYEQAADKRAAMQRLIRSDDYRALLLDSRFYERFGDTRGEIEAQLASCPVPPSGSRDRGGH